MPRTPDRSQKRRLIRRSILISALAVTSLGLPILSAVAEQPSPRYRTLRERVLSRLGLQQPPAPQPAQNRGQNDTQPRSNGPESPSKPAGEQTTSNVSSGSSQPALAPRRSATDSTSDNPRPLTRGSETVSPFAANAVDLVNPSAGAALMDEGPITVATEAERNQVIAPGWKDPWVVFYVTGKQSGYLEPCGCTGLENQKGGLMRRDSLLSSLKERGWNVVPVDAGNQVRLRGKQSEIKFDWTSKAFSMMDYAAVGYGEDDLRLSQDTLVYQLVDVPTDAKGQPKSIFVSANVSIFPDLDTKIKVLNVGERRIGITAFLGDESIEKLQGVSDSMVLSPAKDSVERAFQELAEAKCDFKVLIANATLEESRAIAKSVPGFDLIVTAGGYGEPTYRPELIEGTDTQMVQVGTKGMYAGIVGLFDDPNEPLKYQRLALSSQFEDSPRIVDIFTKYQDQLRAEGMERLGKRQQNHPTLRHFVGSEKCGECHSSAYEIWQNSAHYHATDSIVHPPERSIARNFDPECISCHSTGWNPQEFFPYKTGFEQIDTTPHLVGNGCENCHGPGKNHVDAESGDVEATDELLARLRSEMQLPLERAQDKCLECHDIDNSPDFHRSNAFEEYWEKIKH